MKMRGTSMEAGFREPAAHARSSGAWRRARPRKDDRRWWWGRRKSAGPWMSSVRPYFTLKGTVPFICAHSNASVPPSAPAGVTVTVKRSTG